MVSSFECLANRWTCSIFLAIILFGEDRAGAVMGETRTATSAASLAIVALYFWIVAEIGLLLVATDFVAGHGVDVWFATGQVLAVAGLVALGISLIAAIFCFVWIYRAMAVAHRVMPTLTISPGWAVGWFFVPIASLWKPYEAVAQIVEGSAGPRMVATRSLAGWWWGAWLARTAIGFFASIAARPSSVGGELTTGYGVALMLSCVVGIATACLFQEIVRRVTAAQMGAVEAGIFD
jgi:hypothetical protein